MFPIMKSCSLQIFRCIIRNSPSICSLDNELPSATLKTPHKIYSKKSVNSLNLSNSRAKMARRRMNNKTVVLNKIPNSKNKPSNLLKQNTGKKPISNEFSFGFTPSGSGAFSPSIFNKALEFERKSLQDIEKYVRRNRKAVLHRSHQASPPEIMLKAEPQKEEIKEPIIVEPGIPVKTAENDPRNEIQKIKIEKLVDQNNSRLKTKKLMMMLNRIILSNDSKVIQILEENKNSRSSPYSRNSKMANRLAMTHIEKEKTSLLMPKKSTMFMSRLKEKSMNSLTLKFDQEASPNLANIGGSPDPSQTLREDISEESSSFCMSESESQSS